MSSSPDSSNIGQCSICWSFLTSSNTFVITKCGHTFHQNCINQWITNAKNCPSCRTRASETDVIKLFIQEYVNNDIAVAESQMNKCFTEYIDSGHYVMKKCKCDIIQGSNGDLRYKSINGVYIIRYKSVGIIKVTLPNGYTVTTFPCTKLEILREKTKEKSIVYPDGQRIEYFNEGYKYKHGVVNIDIRKVKKESITFRSENDFARNYGDYIKYFCPGFTVKRSFKNGNSGEFTVKVFSTSDSNKFLMIQACPRHQVFHVKHYDGNDHYCCASSEKSCRHLKN